MIRLFLDCDSVGGDVLKRLWASRCFRLSGNSIWSASIPKRPISGTHRRLVSGGGRVYRIRPAVCNPSGCRTDTVSPDYVYPAISSNTRRFLRALPPQPCDAFLDLCSGSGAAALIAASGYARHAWSLDITPRSTHFAEFNRLLNGIENVTVLNGDLFQPVIGRTFDRIAAHPPYVPAAEQQMIFRDGGSDGEQITAAIIREIPSYLRAGGAFYAVAQATDREGEPFEERVRKWLGAASSDFDVVLVETEVPPPNPFEQLLSARRRFKQILENKFLFSQLKVTGIFYGTILLRRHKGAQTPITTRVAQDRLSNWRLAEWLIALGAGCPAARIPQRNCFKNVQSFPNVWKCR